MKTFLITTAMRILLTIPFMGLAILVYYALNSFLEPAATAVLLTAWVGTSLTAWWIKRAGNKLMATHIDNMAVVLLRSEHLINILSDDNRLLKELVEEQQAKIRTLTPSN